ARNGRRPRSAGPPGCRMRKREWLGPSDRGRLLHLALTIEGLQSDGQHLVYGLGQVKVHLVPDLFGYVLQVALVAFGEDDLLQPGTVGGQDFLLDSADREHPALEGDLAGHADGGLDRTAG